MNNQVVAYDKVTGKVKIIDGAVTIPLNKAKKKGFTPDNLMHIACQLLEVEDPNNPHHQKAHHLAEQAIKECRLAKK